LNGVYRFVSKVYSLFRKVYKDEVKTSEADLRAMHKCILEVTERIDQMKFNTAVSSLMTYVNYMSDMEKIPAVMYATLLKLLSPFTPHLAEEMWARLGYNTLIVAESWPQGDAALAEDSMVTLGVQMNGKMRGTITVAKSASKEETEAAALKLENVARQLENMTVKKIIVVPGRIVNIVAA
ncbi:MAG: class I tRNA ligase family protein, partial [Alphaproteobacteria bacterium]|nr:class I tRNA ligase family protein [Alphaproteobacteria bacterium]